MSPEPAVVPYHGSLDCTYTISVYPGYGVELKVSWGPAGRVVCQVPAGKHNPPPALRGHAQLSMRPVLSPSLLSVPEPGEIAQGIAHSWSLGQGCGCMSWWDAQGCSMPTCCHSWHPSQRQQWGNIIAKALMEL